MIPSISNNRFSAPQKQNFSAKLVAEEPVIEQLQKDWNKIRCATDAQTQERHSLHQDNKTLWDGLVATFKKMTDKVDKKGEMELLAPTSPKNPENYGLKYTAGNGETYRNENAVSAQELLPDEEFDFTGPHSNAVAYNIGFSTDAPEMFKVAHKYHADM